MHAFKKLVSHMCTHSKNFTPNAKPPLWTLCLCSDTLACEQRSIGYPLITITWIKVLDDLKGNPVTPKMPTKTVSSHISPKCARWSSKKSVPQPRFSFKEGNAFYQSFHEENIQHCTSWSYAIQPNALAHSIISYPSRKLFTWTSLYYVKGRYLISDGV